MCQSLHKFSDLNLSVENPDDVLQIKACKANPEKILTSTRGGTLP